MKKRVIIKKSAKKSANIIEVHQFKKEFLDKFENAEKYAVMNADTFKKCTGYRKSAVEDAEKLEGLLKITNLRSKKSIYRKYYYNPVLNNNTVLLSLTARSELGFTGVYRRSNNWLVCITKANWFIYYWCNSDSSIRNPFRWAFCGIILTVLSVILSLVQFFV